MTRRSRSPAIYVFHIETAHHIPAARVRPGPAKIVSLKKRAQGMPGVVLHPQPCVRMEKHTSLSHHRSSRNIDIPCAMVLTLLRALLGVHDFLVTVVCKSSFANLTPAQGAPGPHDFAVRFSRARRTRCRVHRIPLPTFVTIAKRPFCESGTAQMCR